MARLSSALNRFLAATPERHALCRKRPHLITPALALLISACAATPPASPPADSNPSPAAGDTHTDSVPTEPPDATRPTPRPEPEPAAEPCAWSEVRGIAKLLAVSGRTGTWQFFPGDRIIFHAVPKGARVDDEFKALLRRALSGPCPDGRLILFDPVSVP